MFIKYKYGHYFIFKFIGYDIMNKKKIILVYNLLVTYKFGTETN